MKKKFYSIFIPLILFMISLNVPAQDDTQKKLVKNGKITLVNDQTIEFSNLIYEEDKVVYTNISNQQQEHLFLPSVKSIEENEIVFIDKEVEVVNDSLYRPYYPEGIYLTKEEFVNKTPGSQARIVPKSIGSLPRKVLHTVEDNCFFYYEETNKKIKNVFAISHNGNLYFQVEAILKNRNKTDRAQDSDFKNSFVRVMIGGDNYLYTEADLANAWAKGFAYGAVGGAAGSVLAQSFINARGIVWDFKNEEFNIFKHCKDYNDFMQKYYPKGMLKCGDDTYHIFAVRNVIEQIK